MRETDYVGGGNAGPVAAGHPPAAALARSRTLKADLDVSVGVTDDTVTIGTHQPLTGPASAGYLAISQGASAMFDYINDQGGIHGRKIEYLVKDDVYDPTKTVEVTQELVEGEQIFAMLGGLGTPTHPRSSSTSTTRAS